MISEDDWRGLELRERRKPSVLSVMACQENTVSVCFVWISELWSEAIEDKDSDLDKAGSRSASTRSWGRGDRSGKSDWAIPSSEYVAWVGDVERFDDGLGIHMSVSVTWVSDVERFVGDRAGLGSIGLGRSRGSFLAAEGEVGGDAFAGGGGGGKAAAATSTGG